MKIRPLAISIIAYILILGGCASLYTTHPKIQLSTDDAERIVSAMEDHGKDVRSFYAVGIVSMKGKILETDADILTIGQKDPFAMRIEVTHSWGSPLLHILIKDGILQVISFQDRVLYRGRFSPEAIARFLSGLSMDEEMIWSILSGRPPIAGHEAVIPGPGTITLTDSHGIALETLYLPVRADIPARITFPQQSVEIAMSDYREDGEASYAGEIDLTGKKLRGELSLKIKDLSLNRTLPDQIFSLEIPSGYKIVDLDAIP